MDPADLPAARFAWFSPGCTHHSPANAKKLYQRGRQTTLFDDDFDEVAYANSERSRVTMSCVLRYADKHKPEIIVVENVVEVTLWGPGRDGSTFAWWKRTLEKIGYEIELLFLNSQFFPPCPQSRDRIYIVCWKRGNQKPDLDYRPIAYVSGERSFQKRPSIKWDCVCDSHRWYDLDFTVLIVIGLDPQAITDVCRRMGRRGDTSNEQLERHGSPQSPVPPMRISAGSRGLSRNGGISTSIPKFDTFPVAPDRHTPKTAH